MCRKVAAGDGEWAMEAMGNDAPGFGFGAAEGIVELCTHEG